MKYGLTSLIQATSYPYLNFNSYRSRDTYGSHAGVTIARKLARE